MNPWLWFAGIVLIFIGFMLIIASTLPQKEVRSGGVIMIGPIPLIFGTDKEMVILVSILAIIMMVLALLFRRGF